MARKKNAQESFDLRFFLGIISISAFLGIFVNSAFAIPVDRWVDGGIYILMGLALMIAGGFWMFFGYFKDGLTLEETTKIITVVLGLVSFLSGLSIILDWSGPVIDGTRAIIALIAMIVIGADLVNHGTK